MGIDFISNLNLWKPKVKNPKSNSATKATITL